MRASTPFAALALGLVLGAPPGIGAEEEDLDVRWSLSPTARFYFIDARDAPEDVTGFFGQYEFVPNQTADLPVTLGIAAASLDVLGLGDTPLLQVRLASPTSNLGVSGSEADEPFFNQRMRTVAHWKGLDFDVRYRRIRTEALRLFPNTGNGGPLFDDSTSPDARFYRERTGFLAEIEGNVNEVFGSQADWLGEVASPEFSLRGGYEARNGKQQLRFMLDPSNRWLGLSDRHEQGVAEVGGGLLLVPGGLLTLALDFDHERFRENESPILESSVGGIAANQVIAFVPDTDRYTGSVRLRSELGQRAVIEGGFQMSLLEQVDQYTPFQRSADLRHNQLLFYSANFGGDVAVTDAISANGYFKFDRRDNQIDRDTSLYNGQNGTQVDEFVRDWKRFQAGLEGVYRLDAGALFGAGVRYESIDRELDFVEAPVPRILKPNALVEDDTELITFYGRSRLRAFRRLNVSGEIGYRIAPETGYVTDLDDYFYGKARASYTLPFERSVVLSLFAQGGTGTSKNQTFVSGVGADPAGSRLSRDFDRHDWLWGVTASASPIDRVSVFASFFMSRDAQEYDLTLSSLQRYVQPFAPVVFADAGSSDYDDDRMSVVVGTHVQITEQTDAGVSYAFTRADSRYRDGSSPQLSLIDQSARIDSDTHIATLELGHWIRNGFRVFGGYRFQYYDDRAPVVVSQNSATSPFDPSSSWHVVSFGVTLTSGLFEDE